jgi:hypothetical protein
MRLRQQGIADLFAGTATLSYRGKIPQSMRPAQLTPPHRVPVVGTGAVGDENAGKSLAP